ncbi:MAG: S41 family peptidase [Chloroflexi bacterium]|nr:S41 family peptidase [Chloroflexota bacterium]
MLRIGRAVTLGALLLALVGASFGAGWVTAHSNGAPELRVLRTLSNGISTTPQERPKQFKLLNEIWDILRTDFVEPQTLDADKLGRGAIEGVVRALGDAHTSYIDKEQYAMEQAGIRGSYEGIGAHVSLQDGVVVIVSPIAGSPAEQAGVRAGDRIMGVNDESVKGLTLTDVVTKIKGPRGTTVKLLVMREGSTDPVTLTITRAEIKTGTVFVQMLPDGVAHIRISQFAQRTGVELRDALKEAEKQGAKSLVLDLRNNPGGLLDTTVESASQFLEKGVVAYQVDRNGNKDTWEVRPGGATLTMPMVILVNQGSASGSEVLTGALQDYGRATVIGTKTFGKGSVNHIRELSDGSALYVTIARWLTPNGRLIEGKGLDPDITVPFTEDDLKAQRDPQLAKGLEVLKGQQQAKAR